MLILSLVPAMPKMALPGGARDAAGNLHLRGTLATLRSLKLPRDLFPVTVPETVRQQWFCDCSGLPSLHSGYLRPLGRDWQSLITVCWWTLVITDLLLILRGSNYGGAWRSQEVYEKRADIFCKIWLLFYL